MNAQWKSRLPDLAERALLGGERRAVGVACDAEPPPAQRPSRDLDRLVGRARDLALRVVAERIDLPRLDRAGAERPPERARVRGIKHATSETNSRTVISDEPPRPEDVEQPGPVDRTSPRSGWVVEVQARRARGCSAAAGSASPPPRRPRASAAGSAPCASSGASARPWRPTGAGSTARARRRTWGAVDRTGGPAGSGRRRPGGSSGDRPVTGRARTARAVRRCA